MARFEFGEELYLSSMYLFEKNRLAALMFSVRRLSLCRNRRGVCQT